MARQLSYFAEEKNRSNPHFYTKMKLIDLRRKVKRIIQDIHRGNIEDEDLIYFTNDKIISACLVESFEQWTMSYTIQKALMYYSSGPLANGQVAFQDTNIYDERANVANATAKISSKTSAWELIYRAFYDISTISTQISDSTQLMAQIKNILSYISNLDNNIMYNL